MSPVGSIPALGPDGLNGGVRGALFRVSCGKLDMRNGAWRANPICARSRASGQLSRGEHLRGDYNLSGRYRHHANPLILRAVILVLERQIYL